ncbi:MAG: hypothetical protein WBF90_07055 [Rivularia sp. (in: cyanobacteria)]
MELGNGWSWATDGVGQRMELGNGWRGGVTNYQLPMPNAQCPMPNSQFPIPKTIPPEPNPRGSY